MSGFDNALSFKGIKEKDIDYIEEQIQSEMQKSPEKLKELIGDVIIKDSNPFKFRRGDRKLIMQLAHQVNELVEKKGFQHFKKISTIDTAQAESTCNKSNAQNLSNQPSSPSQYLLTKLLLSADRNSSREKEGYRYDSEIKLFASYIRMIAGPLAYETIQRNLEGAIPSLVSTNRYIRQSHCHIREDIREGILRCEELRIYLVERKLPMTVSLSEDATRIIEKVQYDPNTNQLFGFVPSIDDSNGMPIPFQFPARLMKFWVIFRMIILYHLYYIRAKKSRYQSTHICFRL